MNRTTTVQSRMIRAGLAAAIIFGGAAPSATAGERLARLSSVFSRGNGVSNEPKIRPLSSTMNWWSIPRPAREAARKLAANQDASVTRCVANEHGDQVTYEIFAARRIGPFKKSEFVLTSVTEPKTVAQRREQEQTPKARMSRMKARLMPWTVEKEPENLPVPSPTSY